MSVRVLNWGFSVVTFIVTRCYHPPQSCGTSHHHGIVSLLHPHAAVPITPWLAWQSWHHDVGLVSQHHGTGLALQHHSVGLASQHHGAGLGSHCHVTAPLVWPCVQHEIPLALGPYVLPARSRHSGQHSADPLLPCISSVHPFTMA